MVCRAECVMKVVSLSLGHCLMLSRNAAIRSAQILCRGVIFPFNKTICLTSLLRRSLVDAPQKLHLGLLIEATGDARLGEDGIKNALGLVG